jgi:hypothetical protein
MPVYFTKWAKIASFYILPFNPIKTYAVEKASLKHIKSNKENHRPVLLLSKAMQNF